MSTSIVLICAGIANLNVASVVSVVVSVVADVVIGRRGQSYHTGQSSIRLGL